MKKFLFVLLMIMLSFIISQSLVLAQVSFPTRPVTIWVGFPAGGGADIITRALAEWAEKKLGQKIVVINKPGGGGTVAASLLAKEKPDGYTLLLSTDTAATRAPHLRDLDYDPFIDLTYIIRAGVYKQAFMVRSDSPFNKWEEVVDWAKKNPDQLIYGNPGSGTGPHIAMFQVAKKEGFTLRIVPFAGDTPLLNALLGGHVMIAGALAWRSHIEAKTVRALLVFEREGFDYAPEVPTFEKMKYYFEAPSTLIIYAPNGISDSIRKILEDAFIDAMKQERFKKIAKEQEVALREPLTGKVLLDYIKKFNSDYKQTIQEMGIYKGEKK